MKKQPLKKFSAGAITAVIWQNDKIYSVQLERKYLDKNKKWQTTSTIQLNDLAKAQLVLSEAHKFLILK